MPIAHATLPVRDLAAAKAFYTTALAPLGYKITQEYGTVTCGFGISGGKDDFWLLPTGGEEAQKMHMAFHGESEEAVRGFHEEAL